MQGSKERNMRCFLTSLLLTSLLPYKKTKELQVEICLKPSIGLMTYQQPAPD